MTREEIQFINQFQANLIVPIQRFLIPHRLEDSQNDSLYLTIEEILCSLSVMPDKIGEFTLTYLCNGNIFQSTYRINAPIEHIEHCLSEVLKYLELYDLKKNLLPLSSELDLLVQGIKKLLQIVNPNEYGKFD